MAIVHKAKPLGGIPLNYEVVGGTTAPTSFKKENTIWINTDVAIGEHEFSYVHSGVLKDTNKTGKATSTLIFDAGATALRTDSAGRSVIFECLPNTSCQIHKSAGNLWYIATTQEVPASGVAINILNSTVDSSATITVTTGSNANYLVVFVSNASVEPDITLTCLDMISTRADGTDLQNGDVWIQTNIDKASVGFNAIKKNELMVYPYRLKQWDGSEWQPIAGSLYQNDTTTLVYNAQTDLIIEGEVQSFAGGFTLLMQQYNSELTYPSGYMLYRNTNSGSVSRVDSTNKINWSKYTTLKIKLGASDCRYANVWFMIGQNKDIPTWWWPGDDSNYVSFYQLYRNPVWNADTVLELDISNVTNTGIFMMGMTGNVGDLYISDIWIE